ncbi:MAG: hypothetical protein HQL37_01685 [Alphaproteobacteria bacterium]|nr:hypothetical protein [Alphaproteobacteria bacterium]
MVSTVLTLSGRDIPAWSARWLDETLEMMPLGEIRRDVNGNLVDLTLSLERKYRCTLYCRDREAPPLDGVYRGTTLTVGCVTELVIPVSLASGSATGTAARTIVAGSARGYRNSGSSYQQAASVSVSGAAIRIGFGDSSSGNAFIAYRPSLSMMVSAIRYGSGEMRAQRPWSMVLEEV